MNNENRGLEPPVIGRVNKVMKTWQSSRFAVAFQNVGHVEPKLMKVGDDVEWTAKTAGGEG